MSQCDAPRGQARGLIDSGPDDPPGGIGPAPPARDEAMETSMKTIDPDTGQRYVSPGFDTRRAARPKPGHDPSPTTACA